MYLRFISCPPLGGDVVVLGRTTRLGCDLDGKSLLAFGKSAGGHGYEERSMSEDLTQASDAALVVAIGRWRQHALAEAYRRHAGSVYGLDVRVISDPAMSEEIVQEVFLRSWDPTSPSPTPPAWPSQFPPPPSPGPPRCP